MMLSKIRQLIWLGLCIASTDCSKWKDKWAPAKRHTGETGLTL